MNPFDFDRFEDLDQHKDELLEMMKSALPFGPNEIVLQVAEKALQVDEVGRVAGDTLGEELRGVVVVFLLHLHVSVLEALLEPLSFRGRECRLSSPVTLRRCLGRFFGCHVQLDQALMRGTQKDGQRPLPYRATLTDR